MRYIEIILKLSFLALAITLLITKNIVSPFFTLFLLVSIVLGLVLMINKDASYHFKQSRKDIRIRRFEGAIMILFAVIMTGIGL
jgi:hypothetical protein